MKNLTAFKSSILLVNEISHPSKSDDSNSLLGQLDFASLLPYQD